MLKKWFGISPAGTYRNPRKLRAKQSRGRFRPCLDILEERLAPSAYWYEVTGTGDSGSSQSGGAGTQLNPYLYSTLRGALNAAGSDGGTDTIFFSPFLFTGEAQTITVSNVGDGTAGPSDFGIYSNVTIDGPAGGNGLTLANSGSQRLFYVGTTGSLTLENLTLTGGDAHGGGSYTGGGAAGMGGAIFNQGSLSLLQVTLSGNTAQGGSTGISNDGGGGGGLGGDSTQDAGGGPNGGQGDSGGNGGFGGGGGDGYYVAGGSGGFGGGGGYGFGTGRVGGNGGFGGGAGPGDPGGAPGFGGGGSASFGGAGAGMGGAIFNAAGAVNIVNSTLTGNSAEGGSGGTSPYGGDGGNGAGFGSAVFNLNGSINLTNDTLASNTVAGASTDGGALYTMGMNGVLGSSTAAQAVATLNNDIFANTTGGTDIVNNNGTVSGGNNLATQTTSLPTGVTSTTTAALNLGALASNGGPTQTIELLAGSSAIQTGSNAAATAAGLTTDQRGYAPRIANTTVDVGAFEFGATASAPTVTLVDASGAYTGSPFTPTSVLASGAGLNDSNMADFTFDYVSTATTPNTDLGGNAPINVGSYAVIATYIGSAGHAGNSSAAMAFSITKASSTTTVVDSSGTYTGSAFSESSVTATGAGGLSDSNLADFTFAYVGTGSTSYGPTASAPVNAGTYSVTATYFGDANHSGSSSAATPFTIDKASSSTTVSEGGGTYNGNPFPEASVSATGVGGLSDSNVADFTFSYAGTGSTTYGPTATAPVNVGAYSVTATYVGDANHNGGSSTTTPFTINKAGSTTTVSDPGGTYNGNPFPETSVTATGAGGLSDSNLAEFTFSYAGTGSTTYGPSATAPVNAGTYSVTATYVGDANHNGSTSTATGFTIIKASSTTTVTDAGGIYNGNPFPETGANATGANGLSDSNVADFTFSYKGTGSTSYGPTATAPVNAGTYSVTAAYVGDANHNGSTSTATGFSISKASSTTMVTDAGGIYNGSPFPETSATATGAGGLNDTNLADFTYSYSGAGATFYGPTTSAPVNVGSFSVAATYLGDANHTGSSSSATPFAITQAVSTTTVADAGGVYTSAGFAATSVSASAPGGFNDTNLANFTYSYVGTGATSYGPSSVAPVNAGTYSVAATYPTNANVLGSTSSPATPFSITKASSSTTVVDAGGTFNGSAFPATAARATGAGGLDDTNLADFTFSYAGTGATSYGPSPNAPVNAGTYTVTANWVGDANHTSSSSSKLPFTIGQAASVTTVAASPNPISIGQNVTFRATILSVAAPFDNGGTVQFAVDGVNYGAPVSVSDGNAAISDTGLSVGAHTITATYSGDGNFLGSTSTNSATEAVDSVPTITTNPSPQTADALASASFTAQATDGYPTPTTVQWQVSTNNGVTFNNLNNGTLYSNVTTIENGSATLNISRVTAAFNGYEYRAVFSNADNLPATTSAAKLTVEYPPTIVARPSNAAVDAGLNASFTAAATAGNPTLTTVQWQISTTVGGNTFVNLTTSALYPSVTSDTLDIVGATSALNGFNYRAVFSNTYADSTVTSMPTSSATLTVDYAPTVTTEPSGQTADALAGASFTAQAIDGNPTPTTVQWQVSIDNGVTFNNLNNGSLYSNVTTINNGSATLNISSVTAAFNGYEYRAVFSNADNLSATTSAAKLTVEYPPTIVARPSNTTVDAGLNASFTAAATAGDPTLTTVQWQISTTAGGNTFVNLASSALYPSVTGDTLNIVGATSALNGFNYRAVFSNTYADSTVTSMATSAATLTVDYAPTVTTEPSGQTADALAGASFTAQATDGNPTPTTVQWQVSTDNGVTFNNLNNGTLYSNVTTINSGSATLNVSMVTAAFNGYEYRAVFSNADNLPATTSAAKLTVQYPPTIVARPSNTTVDAGLNASFTAAATAGDPTLTTVQWQISTTVGGNTFVNLTSSALYPSVTGDKLNIVGATSALNGFNYRAVFSNTFADSTVTSVATSAATLTVDYAPTVTGNPTNQMTEANGTVTFTASASDGNPTPTTVQWQVSADNGSSFSNLLNSAYYSDVNTTTLEVTGATQLNNDQYRAVFSNAANLTAPTSAAILTVVPSITNPVVVSHGSSALVSLSSLDPAPAGPINYTVTFADPLLTLKDTYGLTLQDGYFNVRGQSEKYLLSANGSNKAGGGWYVLMPTGNLYAWNGSMASTLASTPVAVTAPSVWYNPSLLTANTGAPIVTAGTNPLYDLKIQLGLVTPSNPAYNGERGEDEEYLLSTNGSNPAGGGWYVLMPDDKLYAWDGSIAADQLVADLNPYGNVYANPGLLTNAALPTAVGVAATTNSAVGGSLTLTPAAGFDRAVGVTVTANDDHTIDSQSFTFEVNDTAPNVPGVDPITVSRGGSPSTIKLAASGSGALTYSVSVTGFNPLYDLQQQLGLTQSDLTQAFNARGQGEKYFQSTNGSNAANGGYYVLMPTDKLYAWDGVSLASSVAQAPVADFTQAPYAGLGNVYDNTALLYKASMPANPTVASNRGALYDIKTEFGLTAPDLTQAFNARGQDEKYLQSTNGSNSINGGYYVLMPTDKLYAWDGDSLASTLANAPVANFTSDGPVYAEPSLLYAAQPAFVNDPLFNLKQQLGLTSGDITQAFNARGQDEKYLQSTNGSNSANGGYYVLMPTDKLYAWDGVSLATSIARTPVADFTQAPYSAFLGSGNVYGTPSLLYASTGQTAAVTAVVSSGGVITLTPSSAFAGTVRITTTVSDGAEMSKQSFLFTVTDAAPVLPTISPVTVATGNGPAQIILHATDSAGAQNDLTFAATIAGYNPLYSIQMEFGLNQRASVLSFNNQSEYLFKSANGSNAANGGYFLLTPNDMLYTWLGSVSASTAQPAVVDFTQAPYSALGSVYSEPALLSGTTQPAAPSITPSFTNMTSGGALILTWPTNYTGTFMATVFVGDGAMETQQSFLVTVQ